ncbi:MAG: hypothetical protein LBV18_02370 [Alistipes sp.]|jgi:hypothetical protein|nr:hypothetical protein [Alistipes sp.]
MRLKHYKGRKVHSPFVYGIVRDCLMRCRRRPAEEQVEALLEYLRGHELHSGEALVILRHRKNRRVRRELVAGHPGTSLETRRFLCLIDNERLPKQHFKL